MAFSHLIVQFMEHVARPAIRFERLQNRRSDSVWKLELNPKERNFFVIDESVSTIAVAKIYPGERQSGLR
jgi:hypothetical protein